MVKGIMSAVAKPVMGDRAVGGLIGLDGRCGSDYVRCCAAGGLIMGAGWRDNDGMWRHHEDRAGRDLGTPCRHVFDLE